MAGSSEQGTILAATDLHKSYRMGGQSLRVLQGVDLKVTHGQWLAVLGASGSGKSTLLHLLGALDRPDRGTIHFNGQDLAALRGRRLDRYRNLHVGFVFQFYHLLPELNTLENVLIGAMATTSIFGYLARRRVLRPRAVALCGRLGLGQRLRHRPSKLSGGERQRVAIGRALINRPELLLADEPTGNLDADTGREMLTLLKQFHQDGQTIVMVTHDAEVAACADRQLHLTSGRLTGPPSRKQAAR